MLVGTASPWREFRGERDVPAFIDAAVALHRPLFDRLAPDDRPHFLDYWLRRLNSAHAWLRDADDAPSALVTVPRTADAHPFRWEIRTLACDRRAHGTLVLPEAVDLDRSFTMPCLADEPIRPALASTRQECVNIGAVRALHDVPDAGAPIDGYTFESLREDECECALELLGRAYANFPDFDPALPRHRVELRQISALDAGWCWVARSNRSGDLAAIATYLVMPLELVGVPVALVADLGVDPAHRRRGLAHGLQRFAYAALREAGQRWVYGNIAPSNEASRRQAASLGRESWFRAVRFVAD